MFSSIAQKIVPKPHFEHARSAQLGNSCSKLCPILCRLRTKLRPTRTPLCPALTVLRPALTVLHLARTTLRLPDLHSALPNRFFFKHMLLCFQTADELYNACRFVPMFSLIAHKSVPRSCFVRVLDCARIWAFTRKSVPDLVIDTLKCARFCVVCALNCARILVVCVLNCAQFLLHPALFPT